MPVPASTILSLCDLSGTWSEPYARAGYRVLRIDLKRGHDVRLMMRPPYPIHGVLAAPPCTMFANSGARWPRTQAQILDALSVVDACLRVIAVCQPQWWALENPPGKLSRWLGKPAWTFDPFEFAGYAPDPQKEAYTKKTCLWGTFTAPVPRPLPPVEKSPIHYMPPSPDRGDKRSITPSGFARAFYEANP